MTGAYRDLSDRFGASASLLLTLEAVNGKDVNAHTLCRLRKECNTVHISELMKYLGVSNGRAFMDHDATIPFEVLNKLLGCERNEIQSRVEAPWVLLTIIPCCLEYFNALLNRDARVPSVIRRVDCRKKCNIYSKGFICHFPSFSDRLS